jgi:hypothetical protein
MRDKIPHSLCNQIYVFHPKIQEQSSITGESWVQFLGQLLCYLPTSQQIFKPVEFQCRSSISYMQQTLSFLANNFTQYLNKILKPGEPKKLCQFNPSILHSFLQCPNLHVIRINRIKQKLALLVHKFVGTKTSIVCPFSTEEHSKQNKTKTLEWVYLKNNNGP